MPLNYFLILSAFLFCTGAYGVLARRNSVLVLMSVELMLNAVNLNLVAFSADVHKAAGQVFALFLFGVFVVFLVDAFGGHKIKFDDSLVELGSTRNIGNEIFRNYVIPFEVVSMLLLAALVGAVVLARRD